MIILDFYISLSLNICSYKYHTIVAPFKEQDNNMEAMTG